MQTTLRVKTKVDSPGKIEILAPQLTFGEVVEVIILLPEKQLISAVHVQSEKYTVKRSVVDILAGTPGQRLFKTAADVDAYLQRERDTWEN